MNIKKSYIILTIIFSHVAFMHGSEQDRNFSVNPMNESLKKGDTLIRYYNDLDRYIHEQQEEEQNEIDSEEERLNNLRATLRISLIADRNKVLVRCSSELDNITASKDKNIDTLKLVMAQLKNIKTVKVEGCISAKIACVCPTERDGKKVYSGSYVDSDGYPWGYSYFTLKQVDKHVNPLNYYLYPYRPSRQDVENDMVELKKFIQEYMRTRVK